MKILVADDDWVERRAITRALWHAYYDAHTIVEVNNGKELLDKAASERPGLIISHWNMPEMNGLEALRALRAKGDKTPFAFCTKEASEEIKATATQAGAFAFITHPFSVDDFTTAFDKLLSPTG